MKKCKLNTVISLIVDIVIFVATLICTIILVNDEQLAQTVPPFTMFTTDSNIFMALASLAGIFFDIKALAAKTIKSQAKGRPSDFRAASCGSLCSDKPGDCESVYPRWLVYFRFMGTASVMLTFIVVTFFLSLFAPLKLLYSGTNLFMHLLTPLLSLAAFAIFNGDCRLKTAHAFLGLIPMGIYACFYIYNVAFLGYENGGWIDFYNLYHNGNIILPFTAMLAGAFIISLVVILLNRLFNPGKTKA